MRGKRERERERNVCLTWPLCVVCAPQAHMSAAHHGRELSRARGRCFCRCSVSPWPPAAVAATAAAAAAAGRERAESLFAVGSPGKRPSSRKAAQGKSVHFVRRMPDSARNSKRACSASPRRRRHRGAALFVAILMRAWSPT